MSWPDSRLGEPADPNRPWHWVSRSEEAGGHPLPIGWNTHLRHWVLWDGSTIGPEEAARRFVYLGPCLTPSEAQAAVADAVAAATPAAPPPEQEPRGLAALAASALPEPPPAMVYRKEAIRNHLLIFAGTLFGTLFLAEKFNLFR
ncbi:hypothetical protein DFH01_03010 [Falsiroseomonas bella]|uniref:Uncharacterized protein n=1 Tax=Falsiroseomonas bella TaxID=2184016 RepID=A0A317FK03_9PROT|nr:hypothetical protein [Falsiroseomonas bella]PWS38279.1 hypothetical protein DFH01_03010 [Falsiroseomonas bella]